MVVATIDDQLSKEVFSGKPIPWKPRTWKGISTLSAQEDGNTYIKFQNGKIYFESVGNGQLPHCYSCGNNIEFKAKGGKEIPYCSRCE